MVQNKFWMDNVDKNNSYNLAVGIGNNSGNSHVHVINECSIRVTQNIPTLEF